MEHEGPFGFIQIKKCSVLLRLKNFNIWNVKASLLQSFFIHKMPLFEISF
jgi:hypothetical protein